MNTLQDWIDAGYKRWETHRSEAYKLADFGLQKLISDSLGRRYYITVFVYDRTRYPGYPWQDNDPQPYGFMPTAQFRNDCKESPFYNVSVNGTFTITEVENWLDRVWVVSGRPYYELYEVKECSQY